MIKTVTRFLREPLVHFLALGTLLFLFSTWKAGLVEDYVKEEVYVREAIATELDRDDTIKGGRPCASVPSRRA
jgi:hypothetical protein